MEHPYDTIKHQIKYQTGSQPINCPKCGKVAIAKLSGMNHKWAYQVGSLWCTKARHVQTTCRHCHTSYDFVW
jgi:hypothetical protein